MKNTEPAKATIPMAQCKHPRKTFGTIYDDRQFAVEHSYYCPDCGATWKEWIR